MREIRADNVFAFDVVYRRYSKRIYKFSFSILKSHEEAENITQDVFLNLWTNRNKIENCSLVKYYIFTISYNLAVSIIRKKARETKFIEYIKTLNNPVQDPVNLQFEYNELTDKLNSIIQKLPERQREIFKLHKIDGLKYSEISDKLNISVNTIENHMSRAIRSIKGKLGYESSTVILLYCLFFL